MPVATKARVQERGEPGKRAQTEGWEPALHTANTLCSFTCLRNPEQASDLQLSGDPQILKAVAWIKLVI